MKVLPSLPLPPADYDQSYQSQLVRVLQQALVTLGQPNEEQAGEFLLSCGSTTTTVNNPSASPWSVIVLDPLTSSAASELASGSVYVAEANRASGSFTVTHPANDVVDRKFRYVTMYNSKPAQFYPVTPYSKAFSPSFSSDFS